MDTPGAESVPKRCSSEEPRTQDVSVGIQGPQGPRGKKRTCPSNPDQAQIAQQSSTSQADRCHTTAKKIHHVKKGKKGKTSKQKKQAQGKSVGSGRGVRGGAGRGNQRTEPSTQQNVRDGEGGDCKLSSEHNTPQAVVSNTKGHKSTKKMRLGLNKKQKKLKTCTCGDPRMSGNVDLEKPEKAKTYQPKSHKNSRESTSGYSMATRSKTNSIKDMKRAAKKARKLEQKNSRAKFVSAACTSDLGEDLSLYRPYPVNELVMSRAQMKWEMTRGSMGQNLHSRKKLYPFTHNVKVSLWEDGESSNCEFPWPAVGCPERSSLYDPEQEAENHAEVELRGQVGAQGQGSTAEGRKEEVTRVTDTPMVATANDHQETEEGQNKGRPPVGDLVVTSCSRSHSQSQFDIFGSIWKASCLSEANVNDISDDEICQTGSSKSPSEIGRPAQSVHRGELLFWKDVCDFYNDVQRVRTDLQHLRNCLFNKKKVEQSCKALLKMGAEFQDMEERLEKLRVEKKRNKYCNVATHCLKDLEALVFRKYADSIAYMCNWDRGHKTFNRLKKTYKESLEQWHKLLEGTRQRMPPAAGQNSGVTSQSPLSSTPGVTSQSPLSMTLDVTSQSQPSSLTSDVTRQSQLSSTSGVTSQTPLSSTLGVTSQSPSSLT